MTKVPCLERMGQGNHHHPVSASPKIHSTQPSVSPIRTASQYNHPSPTFQLAIILTTCVGVRFRASFPLLLFKSHVQRFAQDQVVLGKSPSCTPAPRLRRKDGAARSTCAATLELSSRLSQRKEQWQLPGSGRLLSRIRWRVQPNPRTCSHLPPRTTCPVPGSSSLGQEFSRAVAVDEPASITLPLPPLVPGSTRRRWDRQSRQAA
jgi:hypothetical protein